MLLNTIISNICAHYHYFKSNFNIIISSISTKIYEIALPIFSKPPFPEVAALDRETWKKLTPIYTRDAQSADFLSSLPEEIHGEILGWMVPVELKTTAAVCKVWLIRQRNFLTTFKIHTIKSNYVLFVEGLYDIPVTPINSKILVEKFCLQNMYHPSEKTPLKLRSHLNRYFETTDLLDHNIDDLLCAAFYLSKVDNNSPLFISNILRKKIFERYFYSTNKERVHFSFDLDIFTSFFPPEPMTFVAKEFLSWLDESLQKIRKPVLLVFGEHFRALPAGWFFQNFYAKLLTLPKEVTRLYIPLRLSSHDCAQIMAMIEANPHLERLMLNLSKWSYEEQNPCLETLKKSPIAEWKVIIDYKMVHSVIFPVFFPISVSKQKQQQDMTIK